MDSRAIAWLDRRFYMYIIYIYIYIYIHISNINITDYKGLFGNLDRSPCGFWVSGPGGADADGEPGAELLPAPLPRLPAV